MEAIARYDLLLLSGGMDSAAIAYWKRPARALTIDYGQRPAAAEVRAAAKICSSLQIDHHVVRIDCTALGSGDMAGTAVSRLAPTPEWWPFRNQMLLTFAAAYAVQVDARRLVIGTLRSDRVNADGSPEFLDAMDRVLRLQEGGIRLIAPARRFTAAGLILRSGIPTRLLRWSHSCHVANHACGHCRGCNKRVTTWKSLTASMN